MARGECGSNIEQSLTFKTNFNETGNSEKKKKKGRIVSVSKWLCFVPSFEIFSDTSQGTGGSLVSEASVKKYQSDNLSVHESKQEQKKKNGRV